MCEYKEEPWQNGGLRLAPRSKVTFGSTQQTESARRRPPQTQSPHIPPTGCSSSLFLNPTGKTTTKQQQQGGLQLGSKGSMGSVVLSQRCDDGRLQSVPAAGRAPSSAGTSKRTLKTTAATLNNVPDIKETQGARERGSDRRRRRRRRGSEIRNSNHNQSPQLPFCWQRHRVCAGSPSSDNKGDQTVFQPGGRTGCFHRDSRDEAERKTSTIFVDSLSPPFAR